MVVYHLFQKSVSPKLNPAISLIVTYGVSLIFSIILFFISSSNKGFVQEFINLNWASYTLGLSIVGIELGVLLAYRSGWNLGLLGLITNAFASIILLLIVVLFFKERLTLINLFGIVITIAGAAMVKYKKVQEANK